MASKWYIEQVLTHFHSSSITGMLVVAVENQPWCRPLIDL